MKTDPHPGTALDPCRRFVLAVGALSEPMDNPGASTERLANLIENANALIRAEELPDRRAMRIMTNALASYLRPDDSPTPIPDFLLRLGARMIISVMEDHKRDWLNNPTGGDDLSTIRTALAVAGSGPKRTPEGEAALAAFERLFP